MYVAIQIKMAFKSMLSHVWAKSVVILKWKMDEDRRREIER